jgi:hypothetical protein
MTRIFKQYTVEKGTKSHRDRAIATSNVWHAARNRHRPYSRSLLYIPEFNKAISKGEEPESRSEKRRTCPIMSVIVKKKKKRERDSQRR